MGCNASSDADFVEATRLAAAKSRRSRLNHLAVSLPRDRSHESYDERGRLFSLFDRSSMGSLSVDDVEEGCVTQFHLDRYTQGHRTIILRAFDTVVILSNDAAAKADPPRLSRRGFRLLISYVYSFCELRSAFDEVVRREAEAITEDEFRRVVPWLRNWGVDIDNATTTFREISGSSEGMVGFGAFADWALRRQLKSDDSAT